MLKIVVAVASLALALASDPCEPKETCTDCIANHQGCGWCSPYGARYANGTFGPRCVTIARHDVDCIGKYQTDKCLSGWVCGGATYNWTCVPAAEPGEGNPDKNMCGASCAPPPSFKCNKETYTCDPCKKGDTGCGLYNDCLAGCLDIRQYKCNHETAKCEECPADKTDDCTDKTLCTGTCALKYTCSFHTGQPQCVPSNDKQATDLDSCNKTCDWKWSCDKTNATDPKCVKSQWGADEKKWCDRDCQPVTEGYACDEIAGKCIKTNSSGAGMNFSTCNASCPTNATNSTPYEVRGVMRGIAIQKGYVEGEWNMNTSSDHVRIWGPKDIYLGGKVKTWAPKTIATPQLWIDVDEGQFKGMKIKALYQDGSGNPELKTTTFAINEAKPAEAPSTIDFAMTADKHRVFIMNGCADKANCKFHLMPHQETVNSRQLEEVEAKVNKDPCNAYDTCPKCLAAHEGSEECGWCTQKIKYDNDTIPQIYNCGGFVQGKAEPFQCFGMWKQTACLSYCCDEASGTCFECPDDKSGAMDKDYCEAECKPNVPYKTCPFKGVYRGLRIDLNYTPGEYDALFTNTSVKWTEPDGTKVQGDIACKKIDDNTGDIRLEFTAGPNKGKVAFGIYDDECCSTETASLTIAWSPVGSTAAPVTIQGAMTNNTVHYWMDCASYKGAVCDFSGSAPASLMFGM